MRLFVFLLWLLLAPVASAQESTDEKTLDWAPVKVDGQVLFRVRGIEALPAVRRAAQIAAKIEALAADASFRPETLRADEKGEWTDIVGGSVVVLRVTDADARIEAVRRSILAVVTVDRIRRAIEEYRVARTRASLTASVTRSAAAIAIAAFSLAALLWLLRRVETRLQDSFDRRTGQLAVESRQILHVEYLWRALHTLLGLVRVIAIVLVTVFLLQYVLTQFPWTRGAGLRLFGYMWEPVGAVGRGIVASIPNMMILAIVFFITRYSLSLARLYFDAVHRGNIQLRHFEPEWAPATYNLVRVIVIVAALVIAYPYVPGSNSDAFKGISILIGVVLSLGSTSAISNIVAGYMILFRHAFRVGDRIEIDDVIGIVTEMRLQVTHIRTLKNEEVTIPNSLILNSGVKNYSKPAREGALILHAEVGIGYETPWRQVEAMLLEAARRTPGVRSEPPPFVLQRKLGDFAVTYEINAYSDRAEKILFIYADLYRNILDQFNEHGVQIMTPAYEFDPEKPKVVAKDQWFAAPAKREEK